MFSWSSSVRLTPWVTTRGLQCRVTRIKKKKKIVSKDSDPTTASKSLQDHLTSIEKWLQKWRIKVNQNKSTHITFTIRKGKCPPIRINQTTIPQGSTVKYLGLHLDSKLTWREHITKNKNRASFSATRRNIVTWICLFYMLRHLPGGHVVVCVTVAMVTRDVISYMASLPSSVRHVKSRCAHRLNIFMLKSA